jgi:hypothetical protein
MKSLPWARDERIQCQGAKYHSPAPLMVRPVYLKDAVDFLVQGNPRTYGRPTVFLCATCTDNLRAYLALMVATGGQLEWPARREFGNLIRHLGTQGWGFHLEKTRSRTEQEVMH